MLFNSLEYAIFLPLVFLFYWFVIHKSLRLQNVFILIVSYIFYGWWDWRFLSLIIISSACDFIIGQSLAEKINYRKKKILLIISLLVNLGLLGVFKYFNFFVESLTSLFGELGIQTSFTTLNIILPVGISFYTFQTLSYTIDIYKGKIKPVTDPIPFFAFVAFFPQLVAGPIERAHNLLPQFQKEREFSLSNSLKGIKQIVYGLFKKIVIADSIAPLADQIFESYSDLPGSVLALGVFYFAIQIYCDFSGYSDIAIGTGRLLGFELMTNFRMPYFSESIREFWKRWHISLSTWFRDYLYIPLGGNRVNNFRHGLNIVLTFTISGLWHGANWTFIIWGFLHGIYYLLEKFIIKINIKTSTLINGIIKNLIKVIRVFKTFLLVCLAWIFFRSSTIEQSFDMLFRIISNFNLKGLTDFRTGLLFVIPFLFYEFFLRNQEHGLSLGKLIKNKPLRYMVYMFFSIIIIIFSSGDDKSFIYFQF